MHSLAVLGDYGVLDTSRLVAVAFRVRGQMCDLVQSALVVLRPLAKSQDGQGAGSMAPYHIKKLLRAWGVPLDQRHECFSLEKDGVTLGVHDGRCLRPLPKSDYVQTGCSQAGLNLRYLKKADQSPPA